MVTSVIDWTPAMIFEKVKEILVDGLGLEEDEVKLDSRIPRDLGAQSIDFLDINFRLEKNFQTPLSRSQLFGTYSSDDALNSELTQEILEEMRRSFPLPEALDDVKIDKQTVIGDLFTVRLLCQCVARVLEVSWEDPS